MNQQSTNLMEAHEQWRSRPADQRFSSLADLRASVHSRRVRSRSIDIDCEKLQVDDKDGTLLINSAVAPCEPTHWSFGQVCQMVKAPAGYLRNLPLPLLTQCLTHGLKTERDTMKFMTVASEDDNKPNILQAVTSTTYGRIWDADCVDAVSRIVEKTGGKFYNPLAYAGGQFGGKPVPSGLYASDHDVFMFMIDGGSLLEAGERAKLNRGFIVWNSETGAKTFGMMTFLFNVVCGNNIIWGASDVTKLIIRHTAGGPSRFDTDAAPMLKAYAEQKEAPELATIRKAQDLLLPEFKSSDELLTFTDRATKLSRTEIREAVTFAKSEEGECRTLWQLVQGMTAYARGFDYVDTRVDLEVRAGKLLSLAE